MLEFMKLETRLKRVISYWKWLRFIRWSSILGAIDSILILLIGIAMHRGWITSSSHALGLMVLLVLCSILAWFVIMLASGVSKPDMKWLISRMEATHPNLLDRLNTRIYLEKLKHNRITEAFISRIVDQASHVLSREKPRNPFSFQKTLFHVFGLIVCIVITYFFFHRYHPWSRVDAVSVSSKIAKPDDKLVLPDNNSLFEKRNWGEVRITDPGHDMKATKVDVVPLQIEAATTESLKTVLWHSNINGSKDEDHPLSAPTERKYAAYQPMIYLDEYHLSDWDVLTYHAKATTDGTESYASEIYFVEIRPFREDILKMPGGEGGKAFKFMSEFSDMIQQQQRVIRETHRFIQKGEVESNLRNQDLGKLADAEQDLKNAAHHLYARMTAELENHAIGEMLDHIAQAESWMERATGNLRSDGAPEGQKQEQSALTELVNARKSLQKYISDNPSDFQDGSGESSPHASDAPSKDKLKEIAEFRNQANATQAFIDKLIEQQHSIAEKTRKLPRNVKAPVNTEEDDDEEEEPEEETPMDKKVEEINNAAKLDIKNDVKTDPKKLAEDKVKSLINEQKKLNEDFANFESQNPAAFKDVTKELNQTKTALQDSSTALKTLPSGYRKKPQLAEEKLKDLQSALQKQSFQKQLSNAYKLKKMLNENIQELGNLEKQPDSKSQEEIQQMTDKARETVSQLKKVAENNPTRDAFGQPLRDSLNDKNQGSINSQLDALAQSQGGQARNEAVKNAKSGLEGVERAFTQSEPKALQEAQNANSLNETQEDSLSRALKQLESLVQQTESNHPLSKEMESKEKNEILSNLELALKNSSADNSKGQTLLLMTREQLKDGIPLDALALKKLLDEIRNFSVEVSGPKDVKKEEAPVTYTKPEQLPPAYRGRIEKYFEKLSEKQ